ncbi:hypothetical protein GFS60_06617 (plasmid) [Rhodococcus sp. WAY2]|nr:hypothetical protein GFS60_06617 [Rhodococcus sp. WAY2]
MSWFFGSCGLRAGYEGIIIEHMSHIWHIVPLSIIIWQSHQACRLLTISSIIGSIPRFGRDIPHPIYVLRT